MRLPQDEVLGSHAGLGPYRVLADLSATAHGPAAAPAGPRFLLGRDEGTGRVDVLMVLSGPEAEDEGYRLRFRAEMIKSQRMQGAWAAPVTLTAPRESPLPWVAYGCGPALPLPAALAAHGGPLPEGTVRALGAALAETLLDAHRAGLVHAGVSPETVLETPSGPALTGFGLARIAARPAVPGVVSESLPPERRAGDSPQPAGDVYALATVLAYAATGQRVPASHQLPQALRPVLAPCLSPDPSARPRTDVLLHQLAPQGLGEELSPEPPEAVRRALDEQFTRHHGVTAGTGADDGAAGPGPAHTGAQDTGTAILIPTAPGPPDLGTVPHGPSTAGPSPTVPSASGSTAHPAHPSTGVQETASPGRQPSRRNLLIGTVGGALGLGLGAASVGAWRATRQDPAPPRDPMAVFGVAPAPLWHRSFESEYGSDPVAPVLAGPRRGLMTTSDGVIAFDLVTGKRLWLRDDMSDQTLVPAGDNQVLATYVDTFRLLSANSGRMKWEENRYEKEGLSIEATIEVRDGTLYFLGQRTVPKKGQSQYVIVAYRLRDHKERWRADIPEAYGEFADPGEEPRPVFQDRALLLPNANGSLDPGTKNHGYLALSRRSGRELWRRRYRGIEVDPSSLRLAGPGGLLVTVSRGGSVTARSMRNGAVRWTGRIHGAAEVAYSNSTLYLVDEKNTAHALSLRDGSRKWRVRLPAPPGTRAAEHGMSLSHSGSTVLLSGSSELLALDTARGRPRWRLAAVPKGDGGAPRKDDLIGWTPGAVVAQARGTILVSTPSSLYALPVD